MKRIFFKILTAALLFSALSCYDGLNDMYDELAMKVPICVNSITGNDTNDGRGWRNSKQTIQGAINAAQPGDVIWVAGDWTIDSTVIVNKSVSIYGGFYGIESRNGQRVTRSTITGIANPAFDIQTKNAVVDGFAFNKENSGNSIYIYTNSPGGPEYSAIVKNCEFIKCKATPIFVSGPNNYKQVAVDVINCSFYDSTIPPAISNNGALTIANGNAKIENTTFSRYNAISRGGAIRGDYSNLKIKNCNFTENTSTLGGGAIHAQSCIVELTYSDFIQNSSPNSGGAISIIGSGSSLSISGGTFKQNTTSNTGTAGGAVYAIDSCIVNLNGVTFTSNIATANGGAFYYDGNRLNLSDCSFSSNNATTAGGGAINLVLSNGNADTVSITGCSFNDNTSTDGGGMDISSSNSSTITLTACNFGIKDSDGNANKATGQGGALYLSGITAIINNSNFYNNTAATGGGAVLTSGSSSVSINGTSGSLSEIYGNKLTAAGYNGGGLFIANGSCKISYCSIRNNSTNTTSGAGSGGGIYNLATCNINNSDIAGNRAVYGGGVSIIDGASIISYSTISQNIANSNGGGFYLNNPGGTLNFKLFNSKIVSNDANEGTALYKDLHGGTENINIFNSLFADALNETASLYFMESTSTMTNIYNSTFISHGNLGKYYGNGGSFVSYNCIFYGDYITLTFSPNFYFTATNRSEITGINIKTITGSDFTNFATDDYTLRSGSLCVNAGTDVTAFFNTNSIPFIDLAGNPRIVGGTVDIGCYERQ